MTVPILMYHQVDAEPPRGTAMRGLVVSPRRFASHMRLLRLCGFTGVTMGEALQHLRGERSGRVVGITFDDGYLNNLQHALPALQRHGHRATLYAVSQLLGRHNAWDDALGVPAKPLMSGAQLREWAAAGMDVGAHTRHHADLTTLDAAQAREEIAGCRADLEDVLGREVRHFCYPYGRFTPREIELVREAGYATATTVARSRARAGDDPLQLPRVLVARATHAGYFLLKLLTRYEDRLPR